ncbi:MAG: hypothetical protein AB7E65_07180 [Syntrophotalea sp.]
MKLLTTNRPTHRKLLLGLYVPTGLLMLATLAVSLHTGIPLAMFTRDPADITETSPFLGVVSNICILLWCATASICLFSHLGVKKKGHKDLAMFLLVSGLFTGMLLLDDLFLLHERVLPGYLHWRQRYIYLGYMTITLGYLAGFRKIIFRTDHLLLVLALGFFFLSVAVDCIAARWGHLIPVYHLFEDGFKLFGIVSWLGYFANTSLQWLARPE